MESKIVVFIVNSIKQARCVRRIEEFHKKGYSVVVYGFDRVGDNRAMPNITAKVIGEFQNGTSYLTRMKVIRNAIKDNIEGRYDKKTTLYYLFNLDVALAFRSILSLRNRNYIYEVSDLTELIAPNKLIRNVLVWQNKSIMNDALLNVFTSEGFCDYYTSIPKDKIVIIPNRINENCPKVTVNEKILDVTRIRIGFVGVVRFDTVYNFAKVCAKHPNVEFHLFGVISEDESAKQTKALSETVNNIVFHGPFKNPSDLPSVYKDLDMVFSAYPPTLGVIYAEPNKLYEAIYFRCPIIVNKSTFLAKKVERLGVGFVIDAMDETNIDQFLKNITPERYKKAFNGCQAIRQEDCLNSNDSFFKTLSSLW